MSAVNLQRLLIIAVDNRVQQYNVTLFLFSVKLLPEFGAAKSMVTLVNKGFKPLVRIHDVSHSRLKLLFLPESLSAAGISGVDS